MKKWEWLRIALDVWGALSILFILLNWLNIVPLYETKLISKDSVLPKVNLFPGEQIQLDFDSVKPIEFTGIMNAEWNIKNRKTTSFTSYVLKPTITLPPTIAGIYNVSLKLNMQDKSILKGFTNINVIQNEAEPVVIKEQKKIEVKFNKSSSFVSAKLKEIEIYSGNQTWLKKEIFTSDKGEFINLNPGDKIEVINKGMIIRSGEHPNDLDYYKSVPFNR